ncbi:AMP-binding protein [Corynebacterium pelargi]|uniref:Long-chain-fatty-acid--CoA ligase n=1 Tax=Corynebacterium pelargi TaxID=1471400 RepID=A0A410W6V4_9CORY|nr:AMP-binding protein [Corynebacterium pelargi]QAU51769.1 Long-chain-fatty-acid--CoA ligase [Corynebacterium pelargi]GGG72609.1 acyl-CoA synthetase [Corynebacterium pelargi]
MTHRYTLETRVDRSVPQREVFRQLRFFLKKMRERNMIASGGGQELAKDLKNIRRWGGLEATIMARGARQVPDKVALVDDDGELTYFEFFQQADRLARALHARGLHSGANVAVMALNGRAAILPLTARSMAGYNIFMINGNASAAQIEEYLDFHNVQALIVDEEFLPRITERARQREVILGHLEAEPVEAGEHAGRAFESLDHVIYTANVHHPLPKKPEKSMHVVMTSGTTGMPKGVVRRQLNSPQGFASVAAAIPLERNMNVLLTAVLFHAYGWAYMGFSFLAQSRVVTRRHFSAEQVLADFRDYDITTWISAATRIRTVISYMDENGIEKHEGLKVITNSGSPLLPVEIQRANEKFGPVLCSMYGSSETSAVAVAGAQDLVDDPHLTGRVYPGCMVKIFDEDGKEVPEGEEGVVGISCFDLFAGYTDPSIDAPMVNGMYYMGDRGYLKGDRLYVLGRADDLVITQFAEKIYPIEIEDEILRDERVEDAFVHGVPDEHTGQALRAYVVANEEVTPDEIRERVRQQLSEAHVPRDIVYVEDFPRGPTGKVIARDLPEPDQHNQRES